MRLDLMEDAKFENNNGSFSMSIKNHKAYFSVDNDKHTFGSKKYPIGKRASVFHGGSDKARTTKYDYIAEIIQNGNWKPKVGYCYTTSEMLHEVFLTNGVENAKYYSGWIFPTAGYPVHHAWVVVDDKVYDLSINVSTIKAMQNQISEGRDPYSKECVSEVKAIEENWKPIVENFQWGKLADWMIYIGSEETPMSARLKYNNAMRNTPSHPSYRGMAKAEGNKVHFKTKYQHMMDEV